MITTFPSHAEVRCLKCNLSLADPEPFAQLAMLGTGAHAKRCPRCKLVTSYDLGEASVVTPREASAIEFEEPDWQERFEDHCLRWPKWSCYLAEDSAFDATLRDWRRFHWTPVDIEGKAKKLPAGMTEGMIALAKLGIMPPRSAWNDIPRTDENGFQHDDHCWLSISQEQWRITAVEDRMLLLEKMSFDDKTETKQIDLNRSRWTAYVESAVAVLQAVDGSLKTDL